MKVLPEEFAKLSKPKGFEDTAQNTIKMQNCF